MKRMKLLAMVLGVFGLLMPLQALAESYVNTVALSPSAQTVALPATTATYTLSFTTGGNGNGEAVLSVLNLPANVTWTLSSPLPYSFKSPATFTQTLTLTRTGAVPEGTYPFTVQVVSNGSTSNVTTRTASGSLTIVKSPQVITSFAFSVAELNVDGPTTATVSATGGGSGNPVVFSSLTPAVCSVSGSTVSAVAVGTCTVAATQAGNDNYSAAAQVTGSVQVVDTTAPVLNVSMLSDGAVTRRIMLNVAGNASDASGIKDIFLNGEPVVHFNGEFNEAFEMIDGENIIEVIAVDENNLETIINRSVFLDVTAPYLNVTFPGDNSTTVDRYLNIIGTVDSLCTVDVIVNGQSPTPATLDGQNFTASVILAQGMNTIEVVAEDSYGHLSSVKRTVYADDQGLTLQVATPNEDNFAYVDNTVQGTVGGSQDNISVTLNVNGQTYNPPVTNGTFQQTFKLPATRGVYPVDILADDGTGRTSLVQRNLVKIDLATLLAVPSTASVTRGTTVAFAAGLVGGGGPYEYRYSVSAVYGNKNTVATNFSRTNTWSWDTTGFPENTYLVSVALRDPVTLQRVASLSRNIVVTSPGAATGAALVADKPNLMQKGGVVTFTASAKSGVNVEYRFTLTLDGVVKASRSWGDNTWQWNTSDATYMPGRYIIWVSARNVGSSATAETSASMDFTIVADAPAKWLKVSANQPSPKQKGGNPVIITATATSAVPIEYLFKVKLGTAPAETVQTWSTNNAWQWDTGLAAFPAGTYTVYVYCRNVGSAASYETFSSFTYTLVAASP